MRHDQDAAVAAATVADDARSALLADLLGRVAGCFPRRETRQSCGQMLSGLLMELEDHNCWTIAEAAGHRGPHRLQHLLSRAVWDDRQVLDIASAWAVSHLDDGDAVLIVDETADEKSSTDAAGAARQYSGTVGGIALCQVAVTLTYATGRGHALIGRALYLPEACASDEEHRELADVPEEVMFATKPQLAGALLDRVHSHGIRAAFAAGDEVHGGRELRRGIRQHGMGYVIAVRANHTVTTGSGRTMTAAAAATMIPGHAWHRMHTGSGTKGIRHYDWAVLEVTMATGPSADRQSKRNPSGRCWRLRRGGRDPLKTPKLFLGLVACLAASLTACTTAAPSQTGPAALTVVRSPGRHAHLRAGCPLGRLMPPGRSIAIDYVDFLQFGGRMYIANYPPIKGAVLERVITHVLCSLAAEEDQQRGAPPVIDRTAAFLAAGAAVYEVRGYSPSCRLAAYLHGRLQVYLAQTTVHHHIEPLPCALRRTRL